MKYSHTAIKMWQRCPRKWKYRYVDRLESSEPAPHLVEGTELHEELAAYYMGESFEPSEIVSRYMDHYADEDWEVLAAEDDLEMSLWGETVVFKPDLVVRQAGEVWVVDHKTVKTIPDETDPYNMTDFQHLLYLEGVRQQGWNPRGFIFNYIRRKSPTLPRLTKDGRIAYLNTIDTDERTLLEFAEEHGLDGDEDVQHKLRMMRMTPNRWFQRHYILNNPVAVSEALRDTYAVIKQIEAADEYPRHVVGGFGGGSACRNCEFQGICYNEMTGLNTNLEILGLREREKK